MRYLKLKRFLCLLSALMLLLSMMPLRIVAVDHVSDGSTARINPPENFTGLVLTAADDVQVTLYNGFSNGTTVTPSFTDGNTKYYSNLTGSYCYVAAGSGYYTVQKNIYMSAQEAATITVVDATPGKRSALGGWEPSKVYVLTDEVLTNILPSDQSQWPAYTDVFTTPVYTQEKAEHMTTTQKEMEDFISKLDSPQDNMYVYSMGTSAYYGHDIPLIVYTATDLSRATTLEEAAAMLKANGKPTVHYRAYMHGNEPAAGEAALAMLQRLDGTYGETILDYINVYVIPRMNPDGSQNSKRTLASGDDPNRDLLRVANVETAAHHKVYQLFAPEVMLDGHEYDVGYSNTSTDWQTDMLISAGFTNDNSIAFRDLSIAMIQSAFTALEKENLSGYYYTKAVNSNDPNISRTYTANHGTLFFLMESRGISCGNTAYERRMMGQVVTASQLLDYVADNAATIRQVVADERARIISEGATYEKSDIVILESGTSSHSELAEKGYNYNLSTGAAVATTKTPLIYDVVKRSRVAPTAYVIPDGEAFTAKVLSLMDKHGIDYYRLPAGCIVNLQQYTGTKTQAGLTGEKAVTFPNGAYVFCMNQVRSVTLSMLMEPDVTDAATYKGTLAQQNIISPVDGFFPIYRYSRDLNADGTITTQSTPEAPTDLTVKNATAIEKTGSITGLDKTKRYEYRCAGEEAYTPLAAGSTQITNLPVGKYYVRYQATQTKPASTDVLYLIGSNNIAEYTVWLDPDKGSDAADGLSEATAVATIDKAYAKLQAIIANTPRETQGTIIIAGTYTLPGSTVHLPAHDFPVLLTGKTGTSGFIYAPTAPNQEDRVIYFHGDTTLENLTVTYVCKGETLSAIQASGHKLTIGENVTTVANASNYYLNLIAGGFDNEVASTDLTVKSGTWRNVYAAGFNGAVTGDAKLTMTGGAVTNVVQTGYSGTTYGDVCISLSNVAVGNTIYGGNADRGNVAGNVTLTLGKGMTATAVYAGSRDQGNVNGWVTIIADGADLSKLPVYGAAKNIDRMNSTVGKVVLQVNSGSVMAARNAVSNVSLIRLGTDVHEAITFSENMQLDLNGHKATAVTVSAGYTLTVMDSSTDDFTIEDGMGYGILSATGNVTAAEGYLTFPAKNGVSFHRLDLSIRSASLQASESGIRFQSPFGGDELIKATIAQYGIALRVTAPPTEADIREDTQCKTHSSFAGSTWASAPKPSTVYSTLLTGIVSPDNEDSVNIENANMQIYATAYILRNDGTMLLGDTISCTLRQAAEHLDRNWSSLNTQQAASVITMYKAYENVMSTWHIPNVKAAAQ